MIGDPATRYREDPVRMLRAARLSAKLGLTIEAKTAEPIRELKHLLENVPQARLFEEILKMLLSGNAVERIEKSELKSLVISDTIAPREAIRKSKNIRVISTAPLLAEAIQRTHDEDSISSLFV